MFATRVRRLGERLRSRAESARVDDMGVTVSVGVAIFPSDGASFEDLMTAVDQAVAAAKQAGGNHVCLASEATTSEVSA